MSKGMNALKEFSPKGCPFKGYTLYDLVIDLWGMYGWKYKTPPTVTDFIRDAMTYDIKAHTYGADMIMIYTEAMREATV